MLNVSSRHTLQRRVKDRKTRGEFNSLRTNAKFYVGSPDFARTSARIGEQDATRLSVQEVFRGTEETSCSTRPGGTFSKDVSCPQGCASACTSLHGGVLTKVRNCSSIAESSRRNYTSLLSPSLCLSHLPSLSLPSSFPLSMSFSFSLLLFARWVRISLPFSPFS